MHTHFEYEKTLNLDELLAEQREKFGERRGVRMNGTIVGVGAWAWFLGLSLFAKVVVGTIAVLALSYLSQVLTRALFGLSEEPARTYGFNARQNSFGSGPVVPLIYGTHQTWPPIIQQYIDTVSGKDYLWTLYAVSEGPIDNISEIRINDQDIANYTGVTTATRLGTEDQTRISGFEDIRNTFAVGSGGVDIWNDTGSFIYRTVTKVEDFIARVSFPVGLQGTTVRVKVEYKRAQDPSYSLLVEEDVTGSGQEAFNKQYRASTILGTTPGQRLSVQGSAAGVNTSITGRPWIDPHNVQSSNDTYAQRIETAPQVTDALDVKNLGLSVPAGATVNGVKVEIERQASGGGTVKDYVVQLLKAGVPYGINKANQGVTWPAVGFDASGDQTAAYGDQEDLWKAAATDTLTQGDVVDAGFGVRLQATVAGRWNRESDDYSSVTAKVDYIRVTVYYTPAAPSGGIEYTRFDIKMTRVSTTGSPRVPMQFSSVDEIITNAPNYSNVAVLGVKVQASDQLHGQVNTSCLVKGRKVAAITSATAIGAEAWSDNNVECLLDLLLNKRYGLGMWVSDKDINLAAFYSAKTYCNDTVEGEARHKLDLVMDEDNGAMDWVNALLATFRGVLIEADGKYRVDVDKSASVSQVFSDANIVRGSFENSWLSLADRFDGVEVVYLDADNNYIRDSVRWPEVGDKRKTIQLWGIVRRSHALREAKYHYNVNQKIGRVAEFDVSIEALGVDVWDVVKVSHNLTQWGQSGRVVSVATEDAGVNHVITVDRGDIPQADPTSYILLIRHKTDVIEQKSVTEIRTPTSSPEGYPRQAIKVSGLFTTSPAARDAMWLIGKTTTLGKDFRVMGVTLNEDMTRHLTVSIYDATVY